MTKTTKLLKLIKMQVKAGNTEIKTNLKKVNFFLKNSQITLLGRTLYTHWKKIGVEAIFTLKLLTISQTIAKKCQVTH